MCIRDRSRRESAAGKQRTQHRTQESASAVAEQRPPTPEELRGSRHGRSKQRPPKLTAAAQARANRPTQAAAHASTRHKQAASKARAGRQGQQHLPQQPPRKLRPPMPSRQSENSISRQAERTAGASIK
eukprot:10601423-Alexandrium_andersonii.AAC.1